MEFKVKANETKAKLRALLRNVDTGKSKFLFPTQYIIGN
jgi:hypothetical protein